MRRNSSTTMSAPTGIDDSKHYVLMSSELEETLDLRTNQKIPPEIFWVNATINEQLVSFALHSIESDETGYVVCVSSEGFIDNFIRLLLESREFKLSIAGSAFNSKVFKLESGKAYLRLLR